MAYNFNRAFNVPQQFFKAIGNNKITGEFSIWFYFCRMQASYRETLLILISTPLYIVAIAAELLWSHLGQMGHYSKKGLFQNFYLLAVNMIFDVAIRSVAVAALLYFYQHRLGQISHPVLYWLLLVLLQDLAFYTLHWVDHRVRLFWAVHVTHHSSTEFNLSVGFRSSVLEPLYRFVYFIPIAWLGFRPLDMFFIFSLTQMYGIFVHTQHTGRLPLIDWLVVTPSHHRVHHGQNSRYIDRNMGMFLIIWDRLFGTFTPETEAVQYGVTKPPEHHGAIHLITHEFENMWRDVRQTPIWRHKLMYIFGPPGWKPQPIDHLATTG